MTSSLAPFARYGGLVVNCRYIDSRGVPPFNTFVRVNAFRIAKFGLNNLDTSMIVL